MVTKMEYVRVLSRDLKMFFKINKCILNRCRLKAFTIQSKKKIGAWALMRPPPPFQASNHLPRPYRPVCVKPGRKLLRPVFSRHGSNASGLATMSCRLPN